MELTLHLRTGRRNEAIPNVTCFVGSDALGGFIILPGHAGFSAILGTGIYRFHTPGGWCHLAVSAGVLELTGVRLALSARSYLVTRDPKAARRWLSRRPPRARAS